MWVTVWESYFILSHAMLRLIAGIGAYCTLKGRVEVYLFLRAGNIYVYTHSDDPV